MNLTNTLRIGRSQTTDLRIPTNPKQDLKKKKKKVLKTRDKADR